MDIYIIYTFILVYIYWNNGNLSRKDRFFVFVERRGGRGGWICFSIHISTRNVIIFGNHSNGITMFYDAR